MKTNAVTKLHVSDNLGNVNTTNIMYEVILKFVFILSYCCTPHVNVADFNGMLSNGFLFFSFTLIIKMSVKVVSRLLNYTLSSEYLCL